MPPVDDSAGPTVSSAEKEGETLHFLNSLLSAQNTQATEGNIKRKPNRMLTMCRIALKKQLPDKRTVTFHHRRKGMDVSNVMAYKNSKNIPETHETIVHFVRFCEDDILPFYLRSEYSVINPVINYRENSRPSSV